MTTPAKPEMTDGRLDLLGENVLDALYEANAIDAVDDLYAILDEARRARSGEEQAERERDEAQRSLLSREDEFRRMAMAECLNADERDTRPCRLVLPGSPDRWCVVCVREDQHLRLVAERDEARRQRDAVQDVAQEAVRQLGEVGAEKLKAECERDLIERQIDEFAIAIGYGERPDGHSGVIRPELPEIARLMLEERKQHAEAEDFQTWAAEALDQWREGEEHLGPLDDALTAALDELEAKRAETKRLADAGAALFDEAKALRAEVERLKERLVTLDAGRSGAVRLAEVRALEAMRGWRQLPESVRGAVLTEASFLASAIEDYANAVAQDNQATAEHIKKVLEERDG